MEKNIILTAAIALLIVAGGLWIVLGMQGNSAKLQANLQNSQTQETPNTQTQPNPMKIETIKEGTGEGAKAGDYVTVNYVGTLENGTKFDSSIDRGQPFSFTLGQGSVIEGWEQGLLGMKVGEKRKLTIPPEMGYGSQGAGGVIPPNATLIFEVDMVKIGK